MVILRPNGIRRLNAPKKQNGKCLQLHGIQRELGRAKRELGEAHMSCDCELQDKLKEAEIDLATSKEHASQLELDVDDTKYDIELRLNQARESP